MLKKDPEHVSKISKLEKDTKLLGNTDTLKEI